MKRRIGRFPLWLIPCCVLMLALGYLAQCHWLPGGWKLTKSSAANTAVQIAPVSKVVISELMSSNKTAWPGEPGLYSDWVELHNTGDRPVDITGWTLTDNPDSRIKFAFPEQVLEPDAYLIVYPTGTLRAEPGHPYEAPFRLSSAGDALMLYDGEGNIMQSMNVPALAADTAYALEGASGSYRATGIFTPGMANTRSNHALLTQVIANSPLVIEKVMAVNRSTIRDGDGDWPDWVEIRNGGRETVDLTGYGLSDDPKKPLKWRFPACSIGPGEGITVFLSGKTGKTGELHASFKLAAEGEPICLSAPSGNLIQRLDIDILGPDQALVRDASGAYTVQNAKPGRAN